MDWEQTKLNGLGTKKTGTERKCQSHALLTSHWAYGDLQFKRDKRIICDKRDKRPITKLTHLLGDCVEEEDQFVVYRLLENQVKSSVNIYVAGSDEGGVVPKGLRFSLVHQFCNSTEKWQFYLWQFYRKKEFYMAILQKKRILHYNSQIENKSIYLLNRNLLKIEKSRFAFYIVKIIKSFRLLSL